MCRVWGLDVPLGRTSKTMLEAIVTRGSGGIVVNGDYETEKNSMAV